ncbi:NAD(P)-binding domain-containing protein [Actinoplanes sp. NPDC051851]|uniref:NADPH-dependent F420 reductase n=1 Tax=Actinoplanes sp. NPDC051851 TaxID=3154753 RepID=UPI00341CC2F9
MRIGVIGAGQLGGTLATWCAESGHEVAVTSRHPERLAALEGEHVHAMAIPDAADFGDVIIFAPNWDSAKEAVDLAHDALAGKVVIDATNPDRQSLGYGSLPDAPGPGGLAAPQIAAQYLKSRSGFETLIGWAPGAHWVKAFNTIPADVLDRRRGHDPLLAEFICTDQRDAREAANRLICDLGFAPFFAGGPSAARLTETGGPLQRREIDVRDAKDVLAEALASVH